jgi:Flp pilus assembly protein TadD
MRAPRLEERSMSMWKDTVRRRRHPEPSRTEGSLPDGEAAAEHPDQADRWRDFLFKFSLLVICSLWAYSPAYHGDWLWDDDQLLTANPVVQSGSLQGLAKLWFNPDGADYFPLSYSALWLQWPYFGMNPTGYHVVTTLCHIVGALLFWRLLAVMKLPGAWLGGFVFAIHPICVETVGWVSEVKNTLSLPLFLLSCASFVKFDEEAKSSTDATRHYVLSVVFFLLAMLAKTSIVMFPVLLFVYAWWKHGVGPDRRGVVALLSAGGSLALTLVPMMIWLLRLKDGLSNWPLFIGCGLTAALGPLASLTLVAYLGRPRADAPAGAEARNLERYVLYSLPFFWISLALGLATCYFQWSRAIGQEKILVGGLLSRTATAGMAILFYLWKSVWPFNLLPIYPRWEVDPPKLWQFLPWPVMIAAVIGLWRKRGTAEKPTWARNTLFALGFFVLMLLPILGFITISYMRITWVADHFLYLPMLSIIALGTSGLAAWYARLKPAEQPFALTTCAVLLAVLCYSSFRYSHAWANEDALWSHTLATNSEAWQAHNRLGAKKFARGDIDGAFYHFQNSTRLRPDLGETHNNLGTALSAKGRLAEAIEQFAEACRVTPHVPAIHVNLANALAAAGRFGEAGEKYRQLLEREPNNPALINNYGVTLYRQGRKEESIAQFRRALELAPNLKDARESLAVALGEKPDPAANQPRPQGSPVPLELPTSPTLGPSSLQLPGSPSNSFDPLKMRQ